MENYFNYFTDIEQHFCKRRGTLLTVSPLDWALIETWKDSGVPLEAVLRGIDTTFEHYERRPSKTKKINGLAWCAQEVLAAAEDMKEAGVGTSQPVTEPAPGLGVEDIAEYFLGNAVKLRQALGPDAVQGVASEAAATLTELAAAMTAASASPRLEDLERHLTVLEEKLLAALTMTASDAGLVALRAEAGREIRPYRSKMPAFQIEQLQKQFINKRLLEKAKIPRLSLFYM